MMQLPKPLPPVTTLLHMRDDMLQYMEQDLMDKAHAAYEAAGVSSYVQGIFSLDDMEQKTLSELESKIGVGVGYHSADSLSRNMTGNPQDARGPVDFVAYNFLILIAIPVDNGDLERYSATKLLTVLRKGVAGKTIAGDRASRTWMFVNEAPRIAESSDTVMYYAQVWRVALPNVATQPS